MLRRGGELSRPRVSPGGFVDFLRRADAQHAFRRCDEHGVAHLLAGVAVLPAEAFPKPEGPDLQLRQLLFHLPPETGLGGLPKSPLAPAAWKHPKLVLAAADQKNLPAAASY